MVVGDGGQDSSFCIRPPQQEKSKPVEVDFVEFLFHYYNRRFAEDLEKRNSRCGELCWYLYPRQVGPAAAFGGAESLLL